MSGHIDGPFDAQKVMVDARSACGSCVVELLSRNLYGKVPCTSIYARSRTPGDE